MGSSPGSPGDIEIPGNRKKPSRIHLKGRYFELKGDAVRRDNQGTEMVLVPGSPQPSQGWIALWMRSRSSVSPVFPSALRCLFKSLSYPGGPDTPNPSGLRLTKSADKCSG